MPACTRAACSFYSMQAMCRLAPPLSVKFRAGSACMRVEVDWRIGEIGTVVATSLPTMAANDGLRAGLHVVKILTNEEK